MLQLLLVVSALGGLLAWQLSQPVDRDVAGTAPGAGVERTTDPVAAPSAAKPAEAASEVPAFAPPEPEQPSLMVDTARVVAHRVSPAERAEYRRRIEQSADLKGVEPGSAAARGHRRGGCRGGARRPLRILRPGADSTANAPGSQTRQATTTADASRALCGLWRTRSTDCLESEVYRPGVAAHRCGTRRHGQPVDRR